MRKIRLCAACRTDCEECYGVCRCEHCGYCFTQKPNGSVKITARPLRDVLPNYILYFFLAMLLLSGLMKEGFFVGIAVAGIFACAVIDIVVSFHNLRQYGYIIHKYSIMRKEDGAAWHLAFYTALYVFAIGFVIYAAIN
ncbi:MAG: hypothetical protein ACTTKL_00490 [Treponema sp.]